MARRPLHRLGRGRPRVARPRRSRSSTRLSATTRGSRRTGRRRLRARVPRAARRRSQRLHPPSRQTPRGLAALAAMSEEFTASTSGRQAHLDRAKSFGGRSSATLDGLADDSVQRQMDVLRRAGRRIRSRACASALPRGTRAPRTSQAKPASAGYGGGCVVSVVVVVVVESVPDPPRSGLHLTADLTGGVPPRVHVHVRATGSDRPQLSVRDLVASALTGPTRAAQRRRDAPRRPGPHECAPPRPAGQVRERDAHLTRARSFACSTAVPVKSPVAPDGHALRLRDLEAGLGAGR